VNIFLHKIAILIVAAGESKRLGQPKQLVRKNNLTLLENSLNEIVKSRVGDVFLVLGANAELILEETKLTDCQVIINKKWKEGMGESIAFGMKTILNEDNYNGLIICVADQPFLTADILKKVKEDIEEKKMIIKSKYEEGSGPPVYFSNHFFEEMSKLSGDDGAKPLVKKYKEFVRSIDFLKGNIDIDTKEDLKYWR
jgi:molybdenum cofactor cytidylyltransferase